MSGISIGWNSIGIGAPSGGKILYSYSLRSEVFSSPSIVGGGACYLACRYHLCIVPHASLICPKYRMDSILSPVMLTICLLSFCKAYWNCLDTVRRYHCYNVWIHSKDVLWSYRHQMDSEINTVLAWSLRGGLFTSFQRFVRTESSYLIGPLFGEKMGQQALPMQYLWLCLSKHPLSSTRTIR